MNNDRHQSKLDRAGEYLDARTVELAHKHHRRLQQLTREAVDLHQRRQRHQWLRPVVGVSLATAFSAVVAVVLVVTRFDDLTHRDGAAQMTAEQAVVESAENSLMAQLPMWVKDTNTPVELVEHLDFYRWLAQQNGNAGQDDQRSVLGTPKTAFMLLDTSDDSTEPPILLALNAVDRFGHRQRRTAADVAERVSGTTAAVGAAQ